MAKLTPEQREERHGEILRLWCGGMSMSRIAITRGWGPKGGSRVREVLDQYCDRERVDSKDGRSFMYSLARRVHPEAPLDERTRHRLWPSAHGYGDIDDDDGEALARDVLAAADALNEAIDRIETVGTDRDDHATVNHPHHRHRVVLNIFRGRVRVAVEVPEREPARRSVDEP